MSRHSIHSKQRTQQRCLPPVILQWLEEFGEESYDGHGGIRRFFSRKSQKKMESSFGKHFVRENARYLNAYLVESSHDGTIITSGWRTKRVKH